MIRQILSAIAVALTSFAAVAQMPFDPREVFAQQNLADAGRNPFALVDGMFSKQFEWAERAWPILTQNLEHCPKDIARSSGFAVFPIGLQSRRDRKMVLENGGKLGVRVFRVFPGSPGETAGLKKEDIITAVNGKAVNTGKAAPEKYYEQFDKAAGAGAPVRLSVFREGRDLEVVVETVPVCNYQMSMMSDIGHVTMAGRHGELQLNPAFLAIAETEEDRLILLAHEISHHMSGHVKAKSALSKVGGVLDKTAGFAGLPTFGGLGAAGAVMTRKGDEREADELTMQLVQPLGISPIAVEDLWTRIHHDIQGVFRRMTNSHPMSEKRLQHIAELAAPERERLAALEVEHRELERTASEYQQAIASAHATEAEVTLGGGAPEMNVSSASLTHVQRGVHHACGLSPGAQVYCWGDRGSNGLVGDGVIGGTAADPARVLMNDRASPLSGVKALAVGPVNACGLVAGGRVYCWGNNSWGQLGSDPRDVPNSTVAIEAVALGSDNDQIAVGIALTCVLKRAGGVWCIGRNANRALAKFGAGDSEVNPRPFQILGVPAGVEQLAAAALQVCVTVRGAETPWCWGDEPPVAPVGTNAAAADPETSADAGT